MPKATHLESLTRGLWTARDPAFLPEGALVEARNLRYQPGDIAVYQAEGREAQSAVVSNAYGIANLVWDPGSEVVKGVAEPYQLLYVDEQLGGSLLATRALSATPSLGQARSYQGLEQDFTSYVSSGPFEAISMIDRANGDLQNWFVFSGGTGPRPNRNLVLVRGERTTETSRSQEFASSKQIVSALCFLTRTAQSALMDFTWQQPLLQSTTDYLYFGMQEPFTAIRFANLQIGLPENPTVWEYWNGATRAWTTLSVSDGTVYLPRPNYFILDGTVRWTKPQQWAKIAWQGAVVGVTAPGGILWANTAYWWVRVRPTYNTGHGIAMLSKPVGIYETTTQTQAEQRYVSHGLPEADHSTVVAVPATTTTSTLVVGTRYEYWWVWADEQNNHEGAGEERASVKPTTGNRDVTLTITFNQFEVPAGATHVHIYRGEGGDGADGALGLSFPTGKRVYSIPVTALSAETAYSFTDLGTSMTSTVAGSQLLSTLGQPFPAAVLMDPASGALLPRPRNGAPPSASTGDVFMESLVLNDLSDPRKIRFSYPGQPHSFPELFYVNLETKDADRVVAIRSLGNVCGVVATNSVWRLNWLPRESDVDFGRGDMMSPVMGYGATSSRACCVFSPPGQQLVLGIAGSTGLYMTNLYEWQEMVPQFAWEALGREDKILINNPLKYRLELYVPTQKAVWYVHYHPTLVQDGMYPITGPMERPGGIQQAAYLQTSDATGTAVTTTQDAVCFEGVGNTDGITNQRLSAALKTREMWLGGMGNEFKINRLLVHSKESWVTNPLVMVAYAGDTKPANPQIIRTGPRRLEMPWALGKAEFAQVSLTGRVDEDFGLAVTVVGVEAESLGMREAR